MNFEAPPSRGKRRLYYFTKLATAKIILAERRLKLSRFGELNDLFELLGASVGDKLARRVFASILRRHWNDTLGLICFSESWQSPLMWAHYAERHYGVCLAFDVRDDLAKQVRYEPSRLVNLLDGTKASAGLDEAKLEAVLLTKFREWSYEREWRVMARLEEQEPNGYYYVDFATEMSLRGVIAGARCVERPEQLARLVRKEPMPVQVWGTRAAFNEFSIVRQRQEPLLLRGGA